MLDAWPISINSVIFLYLMYKLWDALLYDWWMSLFAYLHVDEEEKKKILFTND